MMTSNPGDISVLVVDRVDRTRSVLWNYANKVLHDAGQLNLIPKGEQVGITGATECKLKTRLWDIVFMEAGYLSGESGSLRYPAGLELALKIARFQEEKGIKEENRTLFVLISSVTPTKETLDEVQSEAPQIRFVARKLEVLQVVVPLLEVGERARGNPIALPSPQKEALQDMLRKQKGLENSGARRSDARPCSRSSTGTTRGRVIG